MVKPPDKLASVENRRHILQSESDLGRSYVDPHLLDRAAERLSPFRVVRSYRRVQVHAHVGGLMPKTNGLVRSMRPEVTVSPLTESVPVPPLPSPPPS